MRIFLLACCVAFSVTPALAQPSGPVQPDVIVRHFCRASHLTSGPEYQAVKTVVQRLAIHNPRIHIAVANSPLVNAWDVEISSEASLICIPVALVRFMGNSEGELAFMVAHEIGHATDDQCKNLRDRGRAADRSKSGAVFGMLFGPSNGDGARDQRTCESRADELGLRLMTQAGYDPEDAAAAFERLSIYLGDTSTGPLARLAALGKDHPITPDRVRHMRKLIAQQLIQESANN